MKININENALSKLSKNEISYLLLLELYENFEIEILRARKKLDIKKTTSHKKMPDRKKVFQLAETIILKLELFPIFIKSVADLILWNQVLSAIEPIQVFGIDSQFNRQLLADPDLKPNLSTKCFHPDNKALEKMCFQENKRLLTKKNNIIPALPIIQINKIPNSFCQLNKWIKEKESEIKKAINDLQQVSPFPLEIKNISIRDINEFIGIYKERKNNPSLTHKKLAIKYNITADAMRQKYSDGVGVLEKLGFI